MATPETWKSKDAAAAVRDFFSKAPRLADVSLMRQLYSDDPFEHRCAAEMARRIEMQQPKRLSAYAGTLYEMAATWPGEEWQARQHILVAAALAASTQALRLALLPLVREGLEQDRTAVRAMALEALCILAAGEPSLRDEARAQIEAARMSSLPALRARARRMLLMVMRTENGKPIRRSDTRLQAGARNAPPKLPRLGFAGTVHSHNLHS